MSRPHRAGRPGVDVLSPGSEFRPIQVGQVDLADGLSTLAVPADPAVELLALIRLHREPLGVLRLYRDDLEPGDHRRRINWTAAVTAQLGGAIRRHLQDDGIEPFDLWEGQPPSGSPWNGRPSSARCPSSRRDGLTFPPASVVVSTRERPTQLRACLDSLLRLDYPSFEVLVVDNDPETSATQNVVAGYAGSRVPVRYFCEPRRGLGVGHNRVLGEARGDILAFTDDDVVVDADWLCALAAPLLEHDSVVAVSGLILPAELETPAQVLLEAHGSFAKGFSPRIYDAAEYRPEDPLFPFTVGRLGSGANMAFDADYLRSVGGFDPALGTGTVAKGGDDLASLFHVVASGHALAYEPGAIVWHHHHREDAAVERQAYGYGVGYGAFLTSAVLRHPRSLSWLLPRIPGGIAHALWGASRAASSQPSGAYLHGALPRRLGRLQRRGLLRGPVAYLASRRRLRQPVPLRPA